MLYDCKAEVTIRQVDNGYIVQWEVRELESLSVSQFERKIKCRGIEIFDSQKKALDFAKSKL